MKRRRILWVAGAALLLLGVGLASARRLAGLYWGIRSSNPVRRGVDRARQLGCFACHGELGGAGIPDPGGDGLEVPSWSGGMWMMYVKDDRAIREFILDGDADDEGGSAQEDEHVIPAIHMPAFRPVLRGSDLEDLVAAFRVLSGMSRPPQDSAATRGHDLARARRCFSCHGAAGSGGLPNPGSLTGFIPGWYGSDFRDLVRSREEFDDWVLRGSIPRLEANPIASHFVRRQRLQMPPYRGLTREELDELWAYAQWLARTDGGVR